MYFKDLIQCIIEIVIISYHVGILFTDNICNIALNNFSTTILYMYTENETVQNAKQLLYREYL